MTIRKNTSRPLGAAVILAGAALVLTAPVHAGANVDGQESRHALVESLVDQVPSNERLSAHLDARYILGLSKEVSGNDSFRVSANTKRRSQQTLNLPNNAGSLQSGATPQPQPASAGEEVKKVLKKNFDKYCGKPNSIC